MSTHKKKASIKTVIVNLGTGHMTPAQRVKLQRDAESTAKASPAYLASPAAQAAMGAWQVKADALEQNEQDIGKAEALVVTLRGEQVKIVFDYDLTADGYGTVVQSIAKGDRSIATGMGLASRADAVRVAEIVAPIGLQIATSRHGVDSLVWDKVPGARLYVMQISVDPATDASWTTVAGGGRRRKLLGLVRGQKYLLRVMAKGARMDGPWSAVLGFTAK